MKVRCINNTGAALRSDEYELQLGKDVLGRFGATGYSEYNELDIGKEYLVMGLIIFKTYQAYLIDGNGFVSACPCQLFEIVDSKIPSTWHFRLIDKVEDIYPFIQAIFGYSELCLDKQSYENLLVEKEEIALITYFQRKIELEKELVE